MNDPTIFDPGPPDSKNDAAPAATGAGVNVPNSSTNSTQTRLPLAPSVRRNAPDTSREAARRIAGFAPTQRAAVLRFVESQLSYGATDSEIATGVGITIQSVNPRRGELATLGLIVLNGKKRPTPSNRPARVWVALAFAPAPEAGGT